MHIRIRSHDITTEYSAFCFILKFVCQRRNKLRTFLAHTFVDSKNKWDKTPCSTFDCSTFYCSTFYCSTFYCSTFYCSTFYCSTFYCSTFYCSTFYCSTFYCSTFYCSCWLHIFICCLIFIGLRVNERNSISKNAVCPRLQKSLAFISKCTPSSMLEVWYWNFHSSQVEDVAHTQHLCKPYRVMTKRNLVCCCVRE